MRDATAVPSEDAVGAGIEKPVIDRSASDRGSGPRGMAAKLAVFAVAALCALPILWDLGELGLHGDEAIYVTVAERVAETGQWAPLPGGAGAFVRKPPLLIWASAGSRVLFGDSEWAYRLPGAVAGWLGCLVTLAFGASLGSRFAGCLAALLLATAPGLLHLHGLRDAVTEPWLLLATASSLLVASRLGGWRSWSALALLSVMNGLSKGLLGLAVVGGTLLLAAAGELLRERFVRECGGEPWSRAALAALVAVLPGTVVYFAWLRFSLENWTKVVALLARDIGERARSGLDPGHLRPLSMIVETYWENFGTFAPLAVAGLAVILAADWRSTRPGTRWRSRWLLAAWIGAAILPVACSVSRLPWYLYPGFPAIALAGGFATRDLLSAARSRSLALAVLVGAGLTLAGGTRVREFVVARPTLDACSLAALDRIRRGDPKVHVFADANLGPRRDLPGNLRGWNAFYIRRFETLEPPALPSPEEGCAFLVTHRPEAWIGVGAGLYRAARVDLPRAAAGDLGLVVLDLCGGRFARTASGGEVR